MLVENLSHDLRLDTQSFLEELIKKRFPSIKVNNIVPWQFSLEDAELLADGRSLYYGRLTGHYGSVYLFGQPLTGSTLAFQHGEATGGVFSHLSDNYLFDTVFNNVIQEEAAEFAFSFHGWKISYDGAISVDPPPLPPPPDPFPLMAVKMWYWLAYPFENADFEPMVSAMFKPNQYVPKNNEDYTWVIEDGQGNYESGEFDNSLTTFREFTDIDTVPVAIDLDFTIAAYSDIKSENISEKTYPFSENYWDLSTSNHFRILHDIGNINLKFEQTSSDYIFELATCNIDSNGDISNVNYIGQTQPEAGKQYDIGTTGVQKYLSVNCFFYDVETGNATETNQPIYIPMF